MLYRLGRGKSRIRMLALQRPDAIEAIQVPPEYKNARRKHRQRHAELY